MGRLEGRRGPIFSYCPDLFPIKYLIFGFLVLNLAQSVEAWPCPHLPCLLACHAAAGGRTGSHSIQFT